MHGIYFWPFTLILWCRHETLNNIMQIDKYVWILNVYGQIKHSLNFTIDFQIVHKIK